MLCVWSQASSAVNTRFAPDRLKGEMTHPLNLKSSLIPSFLFCDGLDHLEP